MKYLPFLDGKYSTAPGLTAMAKAANDEDRLVFQFDDRYEEYLENKSACRKEDIRKYYLGSAFDPATQEAVNRYMVRQLLIEYPDRFSFTAEDSLYRLHNRRTGLTLEWREDWTGSASPGFLDLFDGLCSQVQEDVAVCRLEDDRDWLAAIHLCAPNHWSPAEKIGRPFGTVHAVVPGMEKLNQQYFKMLVSVIEKGPFFRFAWGISTDTRLNHHPIAPPGTDPLEWRGRRVNAASPRLFLRVERQTLCGIPSSRAFLFTIRTYFYDVDMLEAAEKRALGTAVESMSPQSLEYKGLTDMAELVRTRLGVR